MRLLKKINNNFALALDSKGENIIVEGKGVGFYKMPCELNDLSKITRTYYNAKKQDVSVIQSIPNKVLEISSEIFDYSCVRIGDRINPKLTFILAEHIQFCIERLERGINIKMPIYYDIEYLYPIESEIADKAIQIIKDKLNIILPESEKTGIALNIINSEIFAETDEIVANDVIDKCTEIVEQSMEIRIDKDSFSYSRFVTHLQYLLRRALLPINIDADIAKMYMTLKTEYPRIEKCVCELEKYLDIKGFKLNDEEKLFLILHVNRICCREDCNL